MRCTVPGSTPNRAAILRTPSVRAGAFRAARIRFSRSAGIRRVAELFPLSAGPQKTGTDSFLNDAALEFRKDAEHLKHGLARWCSGIETLLMQY
jgi:hypothetical protein